MARPLRCFTPNTVLTIVMICACLLSRGQEIAATPAIQLGGPTNLPVNGRVEELARYAIHQYNVLHLGLPKEVQNFRNEPSSLELVKVVSATQQAVLGFMYVLRFEAAPVEGLNLLEKPRLYEAKIWIRPLGDQFVPLSLEGFYRVTVADDDDRAGDVYGYHVRHEPSAPTPRQNEYGHPHPHVEDADGHHASRASTPTPTPVENEYQHHHHHQHHLDDVPAPAPYPYGRHHHVHHAASAPAPMHVDEYHPDHMIG